MENIDKKTKELFKDFQKEIPSTNFTDFVIQQINESKTYSPLIPKKIIGIAFLLFFAPPLAIMFSIGSETTSSSYSLKFTEGVTSLFSYQNIEVYILVGILLFWVYFLLENTLNYVIQPKTTEQT